MRSRLVPLSLFLIGLAGCTRSVAVPEVPLDDFELIKAEPAPGPPLPVKIVTRPEPVPLPGQLKPLPKPTDGKDDDGKPSEAGISKANEAAKIEPEPEGFINAIQVYPYMEGALYQLYTALNQVSDIALQPGERLISVSAGDTARWIVSDTSSGEGTSAQVHILIKPVLKDISTNLVIATDRRTYHLELHATEATYMASLSWIYPNAGIEALRGPAVTQNSVTPDLALDRVKFRYHITGEAPWKPVQVFDDGKKVYIRFPSGLAQGEAPPLFIIGDDGKPALVNYRVKGETYIVDRLFAAAELRHGTAPQRIVRIIREDARWRKRRP